MASSPVSQSDMKDRPPGTTQVDGTGRHLTKVELMAWTGFLDASRMLEERLAHQLSDQFGMTHREYEVLVRLDGAGGRLKMSELAQKMVASQPLMSQTVNRLEGRNWVKREASTVDRRSTETVLTDEGCAALREASAPHAAMVKKLLLDVLAKNDLGAFADSLTEAADHLRAHRRGDRCSEEQCPLSEITLS